MHDRYAYYKGGIWTLIPQKLEKAIDKLFENLPEICRTKFRNSITYAASYCQSASPGGNGDSLFFQSTRSL
jgi:hypothetical protein